MPSSIFLRPVVAWPWRIEAPIGLTPVAFLHDALAPVGNGFAPIAPEPSAADLDRLFAGLDAAAVCYGHPPRADCSGRASDVNPGALGCSPAPLARYVILEVDEIGAVRVAVRAVPSDPAPLIRAFEKRAVPERAFIRTTFFSGQGTP